MGNWTEVFVMVLAFSAVAVAVVWVLAYRIEEVSSIVDRKSTYQKWYKEKSEQLSKARERICDLEYENEELKFKLPTDAQSARRERARVKLEKGRVR